MTGLGVDGAVSVEAASELLHHMEVKEVEPLNWPYSNRPEGRGEETAAKADYPVTIDGIGYLIDLKSNQFQRSLVDVNRSMRNPRGEESQNIPPEVWRRVAESWHMGAGQQVYDNDDSSEYRYWESFGIDPWTKWEISLLHDTDGGMATPHTDDKGFVVAFGQWIVVGVGPSLLWHDTTNPDVYQQWYRHNLIAPVTSLTTDGVSVIACCSGAGEAYVYQAVEPTVDGIARHDITLDGNPVTDLSFVQYAGGFLVAGNKNKLIDVTALHGAQPGTPVAATLIYTHPLPSHRWIAAAPGYRAIYVMGGQGDRWGVYQSSIADNGIGLDPAILAAELPDGETGTAIGTYMGYVFIGSSKGMRFAVVGGDGLSYGPLIPTRLPVLCFEGQDRFVWFGNSNPNNTTTGLGRVDLSTFTAPLAPAYANDLMTTFGDFVQGYVQSIATGADGLRYFYVNGKTLYREHPTRLVEYGTLLQGDMQFGTAGDKTGIMAKINHRPLKGVVEVTAAYDLGYPRYVGSSFRRFSTSSRGISLDSHMFSTANIGLTLYRDDIANPEEPLANDSEGPHVTVLEVRAVGVPGKNSEWVIPIVIADVIEVHGTSHLRSCVKDLAHLTRIVEDGSTVVFSTGKVAYVCHAVDYQFRPMKESNVDGWQGTFTLKLRELR